MRMTKKRELFIAEKRKEVHELTAQGRYSEALSIAVIRGVNDKPEHEFVITKTRARDEYKVTERELDGLACETMDNPHYRRGPDMKICLLAEIQAQFPRRIKRTIKKRNIPTVLIELNPLCTCDYYEDVSWSTYDETRHFGYMYNPENSHKIDSNNTDVLCCIECGGMISESQTWLHHSRHMKIDSEGRCPNSDYMKFLVCPICHRTVEFSRYLLSRFSNTPQACWISHLITHYRHNHSDWDKRCYEMRYMCDVWVNYEKEKAIVNENAKRQLITNHSDILIANGVTAEHFGMLQHTDQTTLELANKYLSREVDEKPICHIPVLTMSDNLNHGNDCIKIVGK